MIDTQTSFILYKIVSNSGSSHKLEFLAETNDPDVEASFYNEELVAFPRSTMRAYTEGQPAKVAGNQPKTFGGHLTDIVYCH